MMTQTFIDFSFVDKLEGKRILNGYVPSNWGIPIGKSGVTVATGVDIGQMTASELRSLLDAEKPFPLQLYAKLVPFVEKKGVYAIDELSLRPLQLAEQEAELLDKLMQDRVVKRLVNNWNSYGNPEFKELPPQIQTVLYSLAYNFGTNLADKLPNTWAVFRRGAIENDWGEAYQYMLNFPSKQRELRKRRLKEAMLIYELLPV